MAAGKLQTRSKVFAVVTFIKIYISQHDQSSLRHLHFHLDISNRMSTSCLERSGKKPVSRKSSSECNPTSPGINIDFHCLDQTSNIRYQY